MAARTARRGIESSQRLGRYGWRVERPLSWMSCWRRLQVRWDRDAGRWFAFALLACALVCFTGSHHHGWANHEQGDAQRTEPLPIMLVPGLLASARLYGEQLPVLWRLAR
jgi:hypothetical protein